MPHDHSTPAEMRARMLDIARRHPAYSPESLVRRVTHNPYARTPLDPELLATAREVADQARRERLLSTYRAYLKETGDPAAARALLVADAQIQSARDIAGSIDECRS